MVLVPADPLKMSLHVRGEGLPSLENSQFSLIGLTPRLRCKIANREENISFLVKHADTQRPAGSSPAPAFSGTAGIPCSDNPPALQTPTHGPGDRRGEERRSHLDPSSTKPFSSVS